MTALTSTNNNPATVTETATIAAAPAPQQGPIEAGGSLIIVLILGFLLWRSIEKKKAKWPHVIMAFTMGVLLAGSMIGVMAEQTAGSIGSGVATMFSTVTSTSGR